VVPLHSLKPVGPAGDDVRYENEVRERFRILNEFYGWFVIELSRGDFPDMLALDRAGRQVRIEVELSSRSFKRHGHDVAGADLIVCWVHDWTDCPLPVLVLEGEWRNYQALKQVSQTAETYETQNLAAAKADHAG
jgi:hypothetical protein